MKATALTSGHGRRDGRPHDGVVTGYVVVAGIAPPHDAPHGLPTGLAEGIARVLAGGVAGTLR